jgi:hypothetical protein
MDPADEKYDNLDDIMLNTWDISVILACAGSRFRACLTHLQREAEFAPWPSERVTYIRTGLHWELAVCWHTTNGTLSNQSQSFVEPFINYAVSHSMVATPSSVVKLILAQFSQILLQDVPNHIFAAHLMSIDTQTKGDDPSRIVDEYVWAWWISGISVNLSGPLPWDSIRKCVDNHVRQWVRL